MPELTVATLEHNHPLYLHASDMPGTALIAVQLTGPANYSLWSRLLRLALLVKKSLDLLMDPA
uniref:Retrotransposon Copia-like N-terminal domain-containing protein n=1 Tax=Solanum tuberosum TaxID=4113 RepID=M1B3X1_SOLTU